MNLLPEPDYRKFYSEDDVYIEKLIMPETTYENCVGMIIPVNQAITSKFINPLHLLLPSGIPFREETRVVDKYFAVFSGISTDYDFYELEHLTSFATISEAHSYVAEEHHKIYNKQNYLSNMLLSVDLSKVKWDLLPEDSRSFNAITCLFRLGHLDDLDREAFKELNIPEDKLVTRKEANLALNIVEIEVPK